MSENGGKGHVAIEGSTVEEAADAVVESGVDEDRETVRGVFERVAADGVVSRDAVAASLDEAGDAVGACEERVEAASAAFAEADAAVSDAPDLEIVTARRDGLESRRDRLSAYVDDLRAARETLADRVAEDDALYPLASDVVDLRTDAEECRRAADELADDVDAFDRWLASPDHRWDELDADVEALGSAVQDLQLSVERLARYVEDGELPPDVEELPDPAVLWFDLTITHRVKKLVLDDLRTEMAGLRRWETPDDVDHEGLAADIAERFQQCRMALRGVRPRLHDVADDEMREQFADELTELEDTVADSRPPIDWDPVYETVEDLRPR